MLNLQQGEHIVVIIRKHWLPLFLQATLLFFAAALPFGALSLLPTELLSPLWSLPSANNIILFFYSWWLLMLWIVFFVGWTNYYFDIWVVTNERIIDIDQENLFHRKLVSARLERIQDTHVEVEGLLATFFGFGTITLYTAGEKPDIVIENAAHPYAAKDKILAAYGSTLGKSGAPQGVVL